MAEKKDFAIVHFPTHFKMCFQRNAVYNMHSLLINWIGLQSDSLQKTEISLGKLVLIGRMMDELTSMLLCFGLVHEKG